MNEVKALKHIDKATDLLIEISVELDSNSKAWELLNIAITSLDELREMITGYKPAKEINTNSGCSKCHTLVCVCGFPTSKRKSE